MKQNLRLILMTLLCAVFSTVWGETSTMNLTQALGVEQNGTIIAADDEGNVIWTVTSDADESSFDNTRGVHFGTGKLAVSFLKFTTSDISSTITKIVVNASGASGTSAKLDVTVGGTAYGSQQSLTSTATNYTFEGNASGEIIVNLSQTSATKALYLKSIVVTYGTTPSGPTDPEVSFADDPLFVMEGYTATNPITKPSDLTVTYSSNDETVATVDASTGEVTGVAVGEAIITASWAKVENVYNEGSASYNVNVTEAVEPTVYEKVTNANQLVAGNEYLLVVSNSGKYAVMGAQYDGSTPYRKAVEISITDDNVNITDQNVAILTLGGNEEGWTFMASDNGQYLTWSSGNSLASQEEESYWTVKSDDNGFYLCFKTTPERILQYNSSSPRFACYTGTQKNAYLYVKSGSATSNKEDANVTIDKTELTLAEGEAVTATITTDPSSLAVTYTTSDESVAEVSTSGVVTAKAQGNATITATWAEQTIGETVYRAGSKEFAITVKDPNGKGSFVDPYTVSEVLAYNGTVNDVWVKGFIVGYYNNNQLISEISDKTLDTNIALCDDKTGAATENTIPVQLPSNSTIKTSLNIKDNAGMLGEEVLIKGDIMTYFLKNGIKNTDDGYIILPEISSVGYSTAYYSNADLKVQEGTTAYAVTDNGKQLDYISVGEVIPAGVAVVLQGSGPQKFQIVAAPTTTTDFSQYANNNLRGLDVDGTTAGPDNGSYVYYKLAIGTSTEDAGKIGFYWAEANGAAFQSKAHKAYLVLPASNHVVSSYAFDETVGISSPMLDEIKSEGVYTLSGVRVMSDRLPKGIYIVNGKKMVIK